MISAVTLNSVQGPCVHPLTCGRMDAESDSAWHAFGNGQKNTIWL